MYICLNFKDMKNSIDISDFSFKFAGYGHYKVTYTSPITGKEFTKLVNDMHLIDSVRRTDRPKKVDLNLLKRIVKQ